MEVGAVRVWLEKSLHNLLNQNGAGEWDYSAHVNPVFLVSQQRS